MFNITSISKKWKKLILILQQNQINRQNPFRQKLLENHLLSQEIVEKQLYGEVLKIFNSQNTALRYNLQPGFRLSEQYQQIEMYLILWFELLRKLKKMGIKQQYYNKLNCFKNSKNKTNFTLQLCITIIRMWTREKTHLIFRQSIQQMNLSSFIQKLRLQLSKGQQKRKYESIGHVSIDQSEQIQKHKVQQQQNSANKKQQVRFWIITEAIQSEKDIIMPFYKNFFDDQKNVKKKMSKFDLLMRMKASQYQQVKYAQQLLYTNRFILTQQSERQNPFDDEVKQILIKKGYVSQENGKIIVNHSPLGFAYGCSFLVKLYGQSLMNAIAFVDKARGY